MGQLPKFNTKNEYLSPYRCTEYCYYQSNNWLVVADRNHSKLHHHSIPVTLYNAALTNDNQWMMSTSNGVNTGVSRFSTLTNTMLGIYHLEKNSLDLSTSRLYTTFLCKASFLCMFFLYQWPLFLFSNYQRWHDSF